MGFLRCFLKNLPQAWKMIRILFIKTTVAVVPFRRLAGELRKHELRDFHARTQDERYVVSVHEFERGIKMMTWVKEHRGVVHHESRASERGLPRKENEMLMIYSDEFFLL